jgi:hypothetical protein
LTSPFVRVIEANISSLAAATNFSMPVGRVPFAAVVSLVEFIPAQSQAHATAVAETLRTYQLINRGTDGAGTTVLASGRITSPAASQNAFGTGLLADQVSTLPLTTSTALLTLPAGAVLEWESSVSGGTGLRDVGGRVMVTLARI